MNTPPETNSPQPKETFWQRFKHKEISYLTLPLLVMATIVEFVILATGFRYQQSVCVPNGMLVTFFGIGPMGAVILAVELLKLPLAIWTASRKGWHKTFMLLIGLPLICVLTFQLVKDMAVYEMGTAMKPATELLAKATDEEAKVASLDKELQNQTSDAEGFDAFVKARKADRDRRLAELASTQDKAKAEIEESLKRNDALRNDAITLTEYQRKELAEVETRQARLIQQFTTDTEQLKKALPDLRARREVELARATEWNAEEARIENAYKSRLSYYTNRKNAYLKDKAEYDAAPYLKRQVLKEPVDPGVPPERETNKLLKPTLLAELDAQIKSKEAELLSIDNRRRDSVAQVEADARRIREDFDRRSGSKREEADRKREELIASRTALVKEGAAQAKTIESDFDSAVAKRQAEVDTRRPVDVIRRERDTARKTADSLYESRESEIRKTQVHRIATTVEIVRGLIFGERPMSVKSSAKERGDILTDQISMVRVWVYPVLAFIVAFLPTLMVEIGFSTLFKSEEKQQPKYRVGFLGRGLHRLYIRAGRQKILRAERLAGEAAETLGKRDRELAVVRQVASETKSGLEGELKSAREEIAAVAERHIGEVRKIEAANRDELKRRESAWDVRFKQLSDELNTAVLENDNLREQQKSEVERLIRARQDEWLERISQLRTELDAQRIAADADREKLLKDFQEKLATAAEEHKSQIAQVRRRAAEAELAAVDKGSKIANELKETRNALETAEFRLKQQVDAKDVQLSQAKEDAAREVEKANLAATHRAEGLQLDFTNKLRRQEEEFNHRLKQMEQEQLLAFETRVAEEKSKLEQESRRREADIEQRFEARSAEIDARWNRQVKQLEETAQARLKQREEQLRAQSSVQIAEKQTQAEIEARRQEAEFKHLSETRAREAEVNLHRELQQQELAFLARMKQREQDLIARAETRDTEAQKQRAAELQSREEEWSRQSDTRVRALETRLTQEIKQKDDAAAQRLRQREQQLLAQADARVTEIQSRSEQELQRREEELTHQSESRLQSLEARLLDEARQKEDAFGQRLRQREQQLLSQGEARVSELQTQLDQETRRREQEVEQAKRRETDLNAQVAGKDEALKNAERKWTAEIQAAKSNAEAQFARAVKERDEALKNAERKWSAEIQTLKSDAEGQVSRAVKDRDEAVKSAERKWTAEIQSVKAEAEAQIARAEKERDEAVKGAADHVKQVQSLEERLKQVSSLFANWKDGAGK